MAVFAVIYTREARQRDDQQRARERAAVVAVRTSVADVLQRQAALARVIAETGPGRSERWAALAGVVMGQPVANSTGFIQRVAERDRLTFEQRSGRRLVEASKAGPFVVAAPRRVHLVLTHYVQKTPQPPPLGLDAGANPMRRDLLQGAARAGRQMATPPMTFLGPGGRRGVIVVDAVRGASGRVQGWVTAAYEARQLAAQAHARTRGLRLSVRDGADALVADRGAAGGRGGVVRVAGRRWTVRASVPREGVSMVPWLVLVFGFALAGFVVVVLRQSQSRESYAMGLVARRDGERDAAEAALVASEERFRKITERSSDLVARYDAQGRFLWASASWSLLGYAPQDLVGRDASLMVHPDDEQDARSVVSQLVPGAGEPLVWVGRFASTDGAWRWFESIVSGFADPVSGALGEIQCTLRDVTGRVEADHRRDVAEQALTASEERYRTVIDQLAEGIVLQGTDSRILACNAAAEQILGLDADQICGRTSMDPRWRTVYEDGSPRPGRELPAPIALRTGRPVLDEVVGVHKPDGTLSWLRESVTLLRHPGEDEPYAAVASFSDITAERSHRIELERERRDLHEAQSIAGLGSWDYDLARNRPGRWSEQLWSMLGLPAQERAPELEQFIAMVHPEDRDRIAARFAGALRDHQPFRDDFRIVRHDATELHVAFRAEVTRDEHGQAISAFGTIQDVTDRAQRDAEQVALRQIAELVADGATPAAVFCAVAAQVRELFAAHSGAITRFDAAAGHGSVVSGVTVDGEALGGSTFALDGISASAEVFRTGRPARFDQPRHSATDPAIAHITQHAITGAVAAPIMVAGRRWGTLGAAYAGPPVPVGAELRLERFTRLVGMAIANADAWDTLARQAATDPVTGLANHRTFHDHLASEVQRARRYRRNLSVVLFDLDHFKAVNDTHGHQAGDRVLAEVARRLGAQARDGELVARIGGEEFAWLMPETDPHGAYQAADRARRAIEADPFEGVGTITLSAGVCASQSGLDGDDLVRFADRALYWAKDGGRNTTFLYTQEAHAVLARETRSTERFQTMSSVRALARAIDSKDPSTRQHSERVASLAERLALELGWTAKRARLLHSCGLLHDVGKIGIPDSILLKPGPLTDTEYEQVKRHAEMSAHIAAEVLEDEQVTWIRGHHERWDGTGYPDHIAGEHIPDGAQILALADAWDVMTQNRTYKATKATDQAITECQQQSGRQFAPAAVAALIAVSAAPLRSEDQRPA